MNNTLSFFDELNNINDNDEQIDYNNVCLITNEPLDKTKITLECSHTYNYYNIYMDALNQKNNTTYSQYILKPFQLRCPYCRNIQDKILPYRDITNVKKIHGVNTPNKHCMKIHNCKYIFKKGKNKGLACNKACDEPYCRLHSKVCA